VRRHHSVTGGRGQARERVCDALDHRPCAFSVAPGIEGRQRRRGNGEVSASRSDQADDLIHTQPPGTGVGVRMKLRTVDDVEVDVQIQGGGSGQTLQESGKAITLTSKTRHA
jgi:hypothetical protein